jgi:DNA recombination protein RmuC
MDMTYYYGVTGLLVAALAAVVGWLLGRNAAQQEVAELLEDNARLETLLESQHETAIQKSRALKDMRQHFEATFRSLAGEALRSNSSEFMKLAESNFRNLHLKASGELQQREGAIDAMVGPIRDALHKTEEQIRRMEKERQQAFGSLNQHLRFMAEAQERLRGETRNLVNALRRPEVRGQWGELTLRRIAELAGMVEHCDFEQQQTLDANGSRQRPDMVVRMPGEREIIVDAKTPMDGYLGAVEAQDEASRRRAFERHARNLRDRVLELGAKGYWKCRSESLDFVVLFLPGDQFLSAALEIDPKLLEDALADKVVLATPSSLVALLRAVAYGWRQETLAKNAEQIRVIGEELYERVSVFAGHLEKVGSSLDRSVESYNKAVGSFDSRVIPGVRRFGDMGIQPRNRIPELEPVERLPRVVQNADHSSDLG